MEMGCEKTNPSGGVTLEALIDAFNTMNHKPGLMDGRIINTEGVLNYTNSTPHNNLLASATAHTKDISHTIIHRIFQQMCNPPL